jgi:glycosyltransferase involved in cell wall biosynthesis
MNERMENIAASPSSLKVTLVIHTKNEIDGMREIFPKIDRSLFHEIILADASSTDGTLDYARQHDIKVVIQPGKGIADASEAVFRVFTGDIFLQFTPDGNSLPELLKPLIDKMREGYDMVIVSRYLAGAKSEDDDFLTGIGNWFFTSLINLLFRTRYTDSLVGYRAYTRSAIEKMKLMEQTQQNWFRRRFRYMNFWEVGSVVRAPRVGLRTAEIPGDEPKRIGGVRKLSIIKNGLGALLQILWDFFTFWPQRKSI